MYIFSFTFEFQFGSVLAAFGISTKVYSAIHPSGVGLDLDNSRQEPEAITATKAITGSVNEYQLRLGRQRQVWLIPIADERVGVQVKL